MFDKCSTSTGMSNAFGHWPIVSLGTSCFSLSRRVYLYSSDPKYDLQELPECYSWDVFHNTRPFTTPPQLCPVRIFNLCGVTKTRVLFSLFRTPCYVTESQNRAIEFVLHDFINIGARVARDSSVGIATRYGLNGPGIESLPIPVAVRSKA